MNRAENQLWSLSATINSVWVLASRHALDLSGNSQFSIFIELAAVVRAGGVQAWTGCKPAEHTGQPGDDERGRVVR